MPKSSTEILNPSTFSSSSFFSVSLVLRIGGGEPLFGIPALIAYPAWLPFKTVAAGAGMILLPLVSRLTQGLSAPRSLQGPGTGK